MEEIKGLTIDQMKVGQKASFTKTISEADCYNYAGVSGDFNPAHINEEYAKNTLFKTRIAHGMLTASLISAILGTKLPGPGTIYLSQNLKFKKPVYFADTITATCIVEELIIDKNIVVLNTQCSNQNGEIVIEGQAKVLAPK